MDPDFLITVEEAYEEELYCFVTEKAYLEENLHEVLLMTEETGTLAGQALSILFTGSAGSFREALILDAAEKTVSFPDYEGCERVEIYDAEQKLLATAIRRQPAAVTLAGVSLSILSDGRIGMNYYVDLPQGQTDLSVSCGEESLSLDQLTPEKEVTDVYGNTEERYKLTAYAASGQMNDPITLVISPAAKAADPDSSLTDEQEEPEGEEYLRASYSVRQYAEELLGIEEYASYGPLVKAMLNYGATAQDYFSYETETPANGSLTEEEREIGSLEDLDLAAYAPAEDFDQVTGLVPGVTYYGSSLLLESGVTLRPYFLLGEDTDPDALIISLADGSPLKLQTGDGYCYAEAANIPIAELDQELVFTVRNGEDEGSLTYSALNYIYAGGDETDSKLRKVLKALMNMNAEVLLLQKNE